MASLLVCLPSKVKLHHLALTYDRVQKMRRWRRFDGGISELHDVVSTLGCVNFLALGSSELKDLVELLALHFEETLLAIRRQSSKSDFSPIASSEEVDTKPDVDVKPDDLTDDVNVYDNPSSLNHDNLNTTNDPPLYGQDNSDEQTFEFTRKSPDYEDGGGARENITQNRRHVHKYACDICSKTFTVATSLLRHERRAHGNLESTAEEAQEVDRETSDYRLSASQEAPVDSSIQSRLTIVLKAKKTGSILEKKGKRAGCHVCTKTFATPSLAERHRKRVHRESEGHPGPGEGNAGSEEQVCQFVNLLIIQKTVVTLCI